jgi:hypothetical protein
MSTVSHHQHMTTASVFHSLPLSMIQNLHSADYLHNTARLACVIADQNRAIQWETFGLSDFIRTNKA